MMLGIVEFHNLPGDGGFKCAIIVCEGGKGVFHSEAGDGYGGGGGEGAEGGEGRAAEEGEGHDY